MDSNYGRYGGGVGRLMENSILLFCDTFLIKSLSQSESMCSLHFRAFVLIW